MSWNVMICHVFAVVPDAPLPEERAPPAHNARAFRGGARGRPRARRRGWALRSTPPPVGGRDRLRSFVPPRSGPGAGRAVPVSRVSCAGGCVGAGGRIAAARFVRVIARAPARGDGPGRGRTPPVRSRRGFCGPQPLLSAESGTAAPGAALLSCLFYTIPREVNLFWEQKMTILDNFLATR